MDLQRRHLKSVLLTGKQPSLSLNAREGYGHLVSGRLHIAASRTLEHQEMLVIAAGMHGMRLTESVSNSRPGASLIADSILRQVQPLHIALSQSPTSSWPTETPTPAHQEHQRRARVSSINPVGRSLDADDGFGGASKAHSMKGVVAQG
jgi:hypothetical protein